MCNVHKLRACLPRLQFAFVVVAYCCNCIHCINGASQGKPRPSRRCIRWTMIFSVRCAARFNTKYTRRIRNIRFGITHTPRRRRQWRRTALNYAHLKYVCKVSISTLCKKFIVRFPIANSIKCFEFSSLLFLFFYFLPLQRDVNSCAGRLRVLFVPLLVTLFLFFFCILSRSLFVFVFVLFQFQFAFAISFCVYQAFIARSCSCAISVSVFDCAFSAAFQCCCCCFIFNTYNLLIVSLLVFAYAKFFVRFSFCFFVSLFSRLHCELCSVFSVCVCVCVTVTQGQRNWPFLWFMSAICSFFYFQRFESTFVFSKHVLNANWVHSFHLGIDKQRSLLLRQ